MDSIEEHIQQDKHGTINVNKNKKLLYIKFDSSGFAYWGRSGWVGSWIKEFKINL